MSAIQLLAVFVENHPGQTARITRILAEADVNIRWATIASSGSFGVMKFLVDKSDLALQRLKAHGLMGIFREALAVAVDDHAGALHAVADALAQQGINLDNVSGFVANNRAILILEVHDPARARAVLEPRGYHVLSREEMLTL